MQDCCQDDQHCGCASPAQATKLAEQKTPAAKKSANETAGQPKPVAADRHAAETSQDNLHEGTAKPASVIATATKESGSCGPKCGCHG